MFRLLLIAGAVGLLCFTAGAAEAPAPSPTNTVDALIGDYRKATNAPAKKALLKRIGEAKGESAEKFLDDEFNNLDSTDDAQLLGVIFEAWARRPNEDTLHHLIYQGVFHDETNVVLSSALAIGRMSEEARVIMSTGRSRKGKDPSQDLAEDFIHRMIERPEFIPAIERVLVILSRQPRPGFKPEAKLEAKIDEATQKTATGYWKAWFEKRYGKIFVPQPPPKR